MPEFNTRTILEKLIAAFPRPLEAKDFPISSEAKQQFLNCLMELHQRGLIEGIFLISNTRETYGLPLDVINISITREGRESMEPKESAIPVVQNITISNNPGTLNVSGRDMHITQGIDADRFIELLVQNIEKSNLKPEEKMNLAASFKKFIGSASSGAITAAIVETVKILMGSK